MVSSGILKLLWIKQHKAWVLVKKLLQHLLVNAQAEKIVKISLRVLGTNPNAIGFYEHFGFQQEGRYKKEFFLNGRWVDDYQYALYYPYLNE